MVVRLDAARIGRNVQLIRESCELSQSAFGERLGVTGNYVWRVEKGDRQPSLALMQAIARIGGVTLDELTNELPERYQPAPPLAWLSRDPDAEVDPDLVARLEAVGVELAAINREYSTRRLRRQ